MAAFVDSLCFEDYFQVDLVFGAADAAAVPVDPVVFVVVAAPSASLRRPKVFVADLIFAVAGFVAALPLFATGSAAAHGRGHVFFCLRFPGFSK
jgi:hypothetical protein